MRGHWPLVRVLDCGDSVVDYGLTWFRVSKDGGIIKKVASTTGVRISKASPSDIAKVRLALTKAQGQPSVSGESQ